jgi:DNA-binding NtrC family response regulator
LEANPHRFDLVITDYTMPDMTGAHLARRVQKIRTDLPIIMCSGHCEPETYGASVRNGLAAFVMKPLSIEDLARTVRRVLDHSPAQDNIEPFSSWCRTALN